MIKGSQRMPEYMFATSAKVSGVNPEECSMPANVHNSAKCPSKMDSKDNKKPAVDIQDCKSHAEAATVSFLSEFNIPPPD